MRAAMVTVFRGGHALGTVLVLASALVFSLAGVLTKSITADVWVIAFWRGLVGGLAIAAYVAWRGRAGPFVRVFRLGRQGWLVAAVGSLASLAFISAFKLTLVANVAAIYGTAPFLAAGLGWLLMRERPRMRTLTAAALAFLGVLVLVAGDLGSRAFAGDMVAVFMTFASALYLALIRRFRDTPVVWAGGVSGLLLCGVAPLLADPLAVTGSDVPLLVLFGLTFALAVVLWTEGTRLIPAAEAGLLGAVETPFAALLAWMFLQELPPPVGLVGCTVVLAAVLGNAALNYTHGRRPRPSPTRPQAGSPSGSDGHRTTTSTGCGAPAMRRCDRKTSPPRGR